MNTMVSAEEKTPLYDDFTPEKISSFSCFLIGRGEYYRAYVELLRLKSYYPASITPSVFDITSNYLFYKGKKYQDLLEFDNTKVDDDVVLPVSLFRIDSLIKLNRYDDAESELMKLYERTGSENYSEYLNKRSAYLSIMNYNVDRNTRKGELKNYGELFTYSDSIYQGRKKPYLGALAGIVPGMGFVYAGERGTGIVSMILIFTGSAFTYASYRDGWDSLALISGAITFFSMGGVSLGDICRVKDTMTHLCRH